MAIRALLSFMLSILAETAVHAGQPTLPLWLGIDWKRGPDLPQAFQDSDGGIINNVLVTTCGYCDSRETAPPSKKEKSGNGQHKKTWGLPLDGSANAWQTLPDYPGAPRQELCAVAIRSNLFSWGGFSYNAPFTFRDGYLLTQTNGMWQWQTLPELPWRISSASISAIGDSIYIFGGADFQLPENKYFTVADFSGKVKRIGARLLVMDTRALDRGFRECAQCPGTPRFVAAMTAVGGKLYLFGGAAGQDNPIGSYCTIVDNWCYDPTADHWQRLPDTPIATGNFPSGAIVYDDRYILLIGGFQYRNVLNPDGTTRSSFGQVTKHYSDKDYCSDVLVYDTKVNAFGRATPLPLNNNLPMAVLRGAVLHLIGGETGGAVVDGEPFAHHPDLYLVGKIRPVAGKGQ
jgi:N-acetylneuraminic acid mutarotase